MSSQKPSSRRDSYLRKHYAITEDEYNILLAVGGSGCWACGKIPEPGKPRLHVDHNHRNKNVRALLCWHCNKTLKAYVTVDMLEGLIMVLTEGENTVQHFLGHNGKGK